MYLHEIDILILLRMARTHFSVHRYHCMTKQRCKPLLGVSQPPASLGHFCAWVALHQNLCCHIHRPCHDLFYPGQSYGPFPCQHAFGRGHAQDQGDQHWCHVQQLTGEASPSGEREKQQVSAEFLWLMNW